MWVPGTFTQIIIEKCILELGQKVGVAGNILQKREDNKNCYKMEE